MGTDYAVQEFRSAIHLLATGRGRIKERLLDAYGNYIAHIAINLPHDVPEDLRADVERLRARVTPEGEARDRPRLREMSDEEAVQVAELIWNLSHQLEEALDAEGKRS